MGEADKYTTAMWQRALGEVALMVNASEPKRMAFIAGFNGLERKAVHYSSRTAWERGRHTAVLLGYIEP